MKLLSQGAEARVYETRLFGTPAIAKQRFAKQYRVPALDARLRKDRTLAEVRCLAKCRQIGIPVPAVLMVDSANYLIYLEAIDGMTAKRFVDEHRDQAPALAATMGRVVAALHDAGIAHGDLTTSNFMCRAVDDLVLIDFGLGSLKAQPEEKAVDLYVLERAFVSTHLDSQDLLDVVLAEYRRHSTMAKAVLQRLDAVRARGRKRECFG